MAPLVGLAVSVLPSLARSVASNVLPDVEARVTQTVRDVLGTSDPDEAAQKVLDPKVASDLRIRLAEIEAESEKREQELQLARINAELESFKAELKDTQGARDVMVDLVKEGSVMMWGPVIVSTIVVLGFFVVLWMLLFPMAGVVESRNEQIVNIAVGALTAGFATVISFWLGSSQGSRNKDANAVRTQSLVAEMQRETTTATKTIVAEQAQQTSALLEKVAQPPPSPVTAGGPPQKSARQFHKCMDIILRHEGGFAQHPKDPGGATNFGITHKTLAAWREVESCTPEEVRALTVEEAKEIYRARYWNALNCDQLPAGIDLVTFDFGVNAGVSRSSRTLQAAVFVEQDGQIGPITVGAAQRLDAVHVINRFSDLRMKFYEGLSTFKTFGRGWTRRTTETREAALEMARESA